MKRYLAAFSLFYLLVFIFVKAQDVRVNSSEFVDDSVFTETVNSTPSSDYSLFIIALFVLSFISFALFWKHKTYLVAAISGRLKELPEPENSKAANEYISDSQAKIISEVEVHDLTDQHEGKETVQTQGADTKGDMQNSQADDAKLEWEIKEEANNVLSKRKKGYFDIDYSDPEHPRLKYIN